MTNSGREIELDLRRTLRRLIYATVVLYVGLLVTGFFLWRIVVTNADTAGRAASALCALRADLDQRVQSGAAFLIAHPGGAFGISAASIRQSLDSQRRTIATLANLNCPPADPIHVP